MKQFRWLAALVVGAMMLAACGEMQAAVPEGRAAIVLTSAVDISDEVTTVPADSKVLDHGMVPLAANATEIEGCDFVWKLDMPVPPDASGTIDAPHPYTGTITFEVTGDKGAGYTIKVTDDVAGSTVIIERAYFGLGNDARKFTFDPGVTFASPLPAPLNPTDGAGDISHTHFCYGFVEDGVEELTVSKGAETAFTREHFWAIEKDVATVQGYTVGEDIAKVWLWTDGSGDETATWTVDVTYEGYEDRDWNVSGSITIENTGTLDAVIIAVVDVLGGTTIGVDCGVTFPHALDVGVTLTCTYDEDVDDALEGLNVVTVTTERNVYDDDAEILWGDPTNEINETVDIKDIGDLSGEVALGTATAPNDVQFKYDHAFTWADYGADDCGRFQYDNTASIVETGQSADATLKVNVQCLLFKGESVTGAGLPWSAIPRAPSTWFEFTPVPTDISRTWTTGLIQGQPRNDAGHVTLKVTAGTTNELCFLLAPDWVLNASASSNVKVQPLAAAPTRYLAPGQFSTKLTRSGSEFCVVVPKAAYGYAVHLDAGYWMPDPTFGP
jgi:hypothetical protein